MTERASDLTLALTALGIALLLAAVLTWYPREQIAVEWDDIGEIELLPHKCSDRDFLRNVQLPCIWINADGSDELR
jgi:hypothetical protein